MRVTGTAILIPKGFLSQSRAHCGALTAEQVTECLTKVLMECHVNDRIEGGVGVTEPQSQRDDPVRNTVHGLGEGSQESQDKERQPADTEGRHDDT